MKLTNHWNCIQGLSYEILSGIFSFPELKLNMMVGDFICMVNREKNVYSFKNICYFNINCIILLNLVNENCRWHKSKVTKENVLKYERKILILWGELLGFKRVVLWLRYIVMANSILLIFKIIPKIYYSKSSCLNILIL